MSGSGNKDEYAFAAELAREIDRLVIAGHDAAEALPDKPDVVSSLAAHPALLNTVAIVLLDHPLTHDDFQRIIAYTPPKIVDALIDNNIDEGIVAQDAAGELSLTTAGRAAAEGVVAVQEAAVADMWKRATNHLANVERIATPLVDGARDLEAPATPSVFHHFAGVADRPTLAARVLRLITAMRYWRADAHRAALAEAGLSAGEAHALNRLWDAHRDVTRVGQGFPNPGTKGLAALEARQLADGGAITPLGIELRNRVEVDTDRRTAPLYEDLDASSRDQFRLAVSALPG